MENLQSIAKAFAKLLDIEYRMIIGRKGKTTEITLRFDASHFHHLAGFHKLTTLRIARARRAQVFEDVLRGDITCQDLEKSPDYKKISKRLACLAHLEALLDSNRLVFRYDPKRAAHSLILSDFLLVTPLNAEDIYVFISKDEEDTYFCRSFFPFAGKDYTKGQTKYTLLYKEKRNLRTGEAIVQYDKLSPR